VGIIHLTGFRNWLGGREAIGIDGEKHLREGRMNKMIWALLMLGTIGCSAAPTGNLPPGATNTATPSSPTPIANQSATPKSVAPSQSPTPTQAAMSTQPRSEPAEVPIAVAPPAQPVPAAEPSAPVDDPEQRNARLEMARQMDDPDVEVLRNPNWKITIRGMQAWNGVNNTGDLSYEGCDRDGQCLNLTGGKMSCRDGICGMSWSNGDYVYNLTAPMTEEGKAPSKSDMRLKVWQGDKLIVDESGLTAVNARGQ
jgi:hypothetical protein